MNKIIVHAMLIGIWSIGSFGCDQKNTVTTESGIEITYFTKAEGQPFNDGDVLFYHMRYTDENGNELFNTASRNAAVPIQYNAEQWKISGLLYEALMECTVGDSATFSIPAQNLFGQTFKGRVPDSIRTESKITFIVGVEKVKTTEELEAERMVQQEEMQAMLEQKLSEDINTIDNHLVANNIKAQTTNSGLRYVVTQKGKGDTPVAGQTVVVHYNGTLLDGTKFDSSFDRGQPFSFPIGYGQVIKGWDEGLALLNAGSKATLYIPSPLAYGAQQKGQIIKPFSILKFDVELLEIKNQ